MSRSRCGEVERERERHRQRDRPAHARPADDHPQLPRRPPRPHRLAPVDRANQEDDGLLPDQPREHDRGADRGGVAEQRLPAGALEAVEHDRQLQPDEHEQRRVEQELQQLPHVEALDAGRGGGDPRRLPADVAADGDRREHGRDVEVLGGHVRRVGRQQADRVLHQRVVELGAHPRDHPARRPARSRSRPRPSRGTPSSRPRARKAAPAAAASAIR